MRIRRILTGLVILVVGAAAAIFAIVSSIDFNAYKDLITQQVKAATGRDLVLGGDVKVALSLTPRLAVDQVSFRNADWGSEPQMVKLDKIEADVDLIPLLSSQVRIKRLHLIGADILLETDTKGQGNWAMGNGASAGGPLPELDEASIENSRIRFKDGATGKLRTIAVDKLTIQTADTHGMLAVDFDGKIDDVPLTVKGVTSGLTSFVQGPLSIDATGQIAGNDLGIKGQIVQPAALEGINLELYLAGSSTDQLASLAGVGAPKLGAIQLRTKLSEEGGKYVFDEIAAKLGGSDLTGKIALDRSQVPQPPSIDAALASSHLDLTDFGIHPDVGGNSVASNRVFSPAPWDFSDLRLMDGHVRLNVQQLVAGKTVLDNLVGEISLKAGVLKITSVTANLGEGTVGLAANVEAAEGPPSIQARFRASNVDGVPLMEAMGLGGAVTAGRINLEAQLEGPGTSLSDLMAKSNGGLHLEMGEGAIRNDFARLMFADLFQLMTFGGTSDAAHVDCVVTDLVSVDGIANTRSMVLDTPGVTIVGNGDINLRDETLHLRFDSNSKQVNLANLAVPLNVGGTLSHPSVSPDALGAVGDTANFAARAANTATFGVLNSLTGVGGSNVGANPCIDAAAAGAKAKQSSATDKIINGVGEAAQGVGQGAQDLGQGAVDATKKAGEGAGQMLDDLGKNLGGVFGN